MCMTPLDPFDMTVKNVLHTKNKDGFSDPAVLVNLWKPGIMCYCLKKSI